MKLSFSFDLRGWFKGWFTSKKSRRQIKGNNNALDSVVIRHNDDSAQNDPDASYYKGLSEGYLKALKLVLKDQNKKS